MFSYPKRNRSCLRLEDCDDLRSCAGLSSALRRSRCDDPRSERSKSLSPEQYAFESSRSQSLSRVSIWTWELSILPSKPERGTRKSRSSLDSLGRYQGCDHLRESSLIALKYHDELPVYLILPLPLKVPSASIFPLLI